VLFAIWTGRKGDTTRDTPRTSEIGLMVPRSSAAVDDAYREGVAKGVHVIEEPHDDVFGRTFVIANPDGNLIRVSPVD
jgi:conserved hypothetical protein